MRGVLIVLSLCAAALQVGAQSRPPDELYRGPMWGYRDVDYVPPATGGPVKFGPSRLHVRYLDPGQTYELLADTQSNSLRPIAASAVTVRLAFGPTQHGMITFRMRAVESRRDVPLTIVPNAASTIVPFRIVADDPSPGALALKPQMQIVFTLERIDGEGSGRLFENRDAIELLWEALGRPGPSTP